MRLHEHLGIGVVIAVQCLVLVAIPARNLITRATGRDVTLWTAPVDPYDPLSGYYVTLGYEVEASALVVREQLGTEGTVWITVRQKTPAWEFVAVTVDRPAPAPDEVSMRASWSGWRATLDGASRLYIPETQRDRVAALLNEARQRGLVDLRVGEGGDVAVLRLRVGGVTFGESK